MTAAGDAADDSPEVEDVLLLARVPGLGGFITRDGGKTSEASDNCSDHPLPRQRG